MPYSGASFAASAPAPSGRRRRAGRYSPAPDTARAFSDECLLRCSLVPRNGFPPIYAVQHHMNMTVEHFRYAFPGTQCHSMAKRRAILVAGGCHFIGKRQNFWARICHGHASPCHFDHAPVVQSVADGHRRCHRQAEIRCQRRNGLALVGVRVVDLNVAGHGRADAQAGETLRKVGEQPAAQRRPV